MIIILMIPRPEPIQQIIASFRVHPATTLLGPRQCGKTTLARIIAEQEGAATIFDLENPVDIQRLTVPMQILKDLEGLVIIDEVQRNPELFELLRCDEIGCQIGVDSGGLHIQGVQGRRRSRPTASPWQHRI